MNNKTSTAPSAHLNLPKGGGAIRGIGETFQPNPFSGTGSLSVPIPVSTCRGFEPQLSLDYSSGSGNGPFGLGFRLSLPYISRKTGKGTPQYQDAGTEPDTFLMNGAEDLVPKLVEGPPGAWNPVETTITDETATYKVVQYCPRTEGGFAKIERWARSDTGEAHWRITGPDGVLTRYGFYDTSRIADPDDTSRVFQWLIDEARDLKSNVIAYTYKPEDLENVPDALHESGRSVGANRYIQKIQYGSFEETPNVWQWHFEMIFDYGEREEEDPNSLPFQTVEPWLRRQDSFSNYQPGFEVRTHRLCHRILVFHRFPEENDGNPFLVRAMQLVYDESPIVSRLSDVIQTGFRYDADGDYSAKSLPPLTFTYTGFGDWQPDQFKPLETENGHEIPGYMNVGDYQMIDLEGEGLPGIFYDAPDSSIYWKPKGDGQFAPPRNRQQFPIERARAGAYTLADPDSDGRLDLVVTDPQRPGYYAGRDDRGWSNFQPFNSFPTEQQLPNALMADFTGNGLSDLIVIENQGIRLYFSLGKAGFDTPICRPMPPGLAVTTHFSEREALRLGDPFGDGGNHLIRVRDGSVDCWPHLGYGRFGEKISLGHAPRFGEALDAHRLFLADIDGTGPTDLVYARQGRLDIYYNQSGNSFSEPVSLPLPQRYDDLEHVQFADVLGNGTACLVITSRRADGSLRHEYYDFCNAQKPHLLVGQDNNLGATTLFQYKSSTQYYLEDLKAGNPWRTRLHFPVQLLEKTETIDHSSGAKFTSRYAYHEGYFDPVEREFRGFGLVERWDTETFDEYNKKGLHGEAAFIRTTETEYVAPVYVKTWYHTGALPEDGSLSRFYADDYYTGDTGAYAMPDSIVENTAVDDSAETLRQASRALHGQVLREEVYADDGNAHPYTVEESNFQVRILQPGAIQKYAVFLVSPRENISYHYERNATDPRIEHHFTLITDNYGYPVRTARVYYPRRAVGSVETEQATGHITVSERQLIHLEADGYRLGIPAVSLAYEIGGLTLTQGTYTDFVTLDQHITDALESVLPFEQNISGGDPEARLLSYSRSYYWDTTQSNAMPPGQATALALPHHSEHAVCTPELLADVFGDKLAETLPTTDPMLLEAGYVFDAATNLWWEPGPVSGFGTATQFYLPEAVTDPFGNTTSLGYDSYLLLPTTITDPSGNITSGEVDYQVLEMYSITDPNQSISEVCFDALGMVIATTIYGAEEDTPKGDLPIDQYQPIDAPDLDTILAAPLDYLQDVTTYFYYDLDAWRNDGQPVRTATLMRETHTHDLQGEEVTDVRIVIGYTDGLGRTLQTKLQSGPGMAWSMDPVDGPVESAVDQRWLVSGRTIYNNKGLPVRQYDPFYSAGSDYESEEELVTHGLSYLLHYDPLGRVVRTDTPKGFFSKVGFDPWSQRSFDANDTVTESAYYLENNGEEGLDAGEQDALDKAASHVNTPDEVVYDSLGRAFLSISKLKENDAEADWLKTRVEYDISGNELSSVDARLPYNDPSLRNFIHRFAMNGQILHVDSLDAGKRWMLNDIQGASLYTWDERGFLTTLQYDDYRRPTGVHVRGYNGANTGMDHLIQRIEYGDTTMISKNLNGRVTHHYDSAGLVTFDLYSFDGKPIKITRQIRKEYIEEADWTIIDQAALETEGYTEENTYNALGQVITQTSADGSVKTIAYHPEGWLKKLDLSYYDGTTVTDYKIIEDMTYDAKGQRTTVNYGNGTTTTYTYESETFRLWQIQTLRESDTKLLQNLEYRYDPVGNITRIEDRSLTEVFPNLPDVDPISDYTYDALYRLTHATGRLHPDLDGNEYKNGSDPNVFKQSRFMTLDTATALDTYTQQYSYDKGHNLTQIAHTTTSGIHDWTRDISIAPDSNRGVLSSMLDGGAVDDFYDAHGNLTTAEHLQALTWNHADHLASVTLGNAGTTKSAKTRKMSFFERLYALIIKILFRIFGRRRNTTKVADSESNDQEHYAYDAPGQRVRKIKTTSSGNMASETRYPGSLEITLDSDGNVTQKHLKVRSDAHATVTVHQPSGTSAQLRYQLDNHLGSVALELDNQANTLSYEEYLPYGGTALIAGTDQDEVEPKTHRYSGKERDDFSSLCYYGVRYYTPWMGRWLNPDPAGTVDGLNLYAFVGGNPVNFADIGGKGKGKKGEGNDLDRNRQKAGVLAQKIKTSLLEESMEKARDRDGKEMDMLHGKEKITVSPKKMSTEQSYLRHLSTVIFYQDSKKLGEVQAAISHKQKTIFLASNKSQQKLENNVKKVEIWRENNSQEGLKLPSTPAKDSNDRIYRHFSKFNREINSLYADYKIEPVPSSRNTSPLHAEIKIVDHAKSNGYDLDFIAGIKRPCVSCYIALSLREISSEKFNPHYGHFWWSDDVNLSLAGYQAEEVEKVLASQKFRSRFINELTEAENVDTDSENEEAAV